MAHFRVWLIGTMYTLGLILNECAYFLELERLTSWHFSTATQTQYCY